MSTSTVQELLQGVDSEDGNLCCAGMVGRHHAGQ